MEKQQSWMIRDGSETDLEKILSLRKIVFGEMEKDKLRPEFWKWEFNEGPDGKGFIYVAEEGNKVIGHFADIPRRFSVGGRVLLGTLSLDLMVHPDYWRRGIFGKMGRYGIQRVKEKEGFFMTAYPIRRETIHGLKKIGWKEVVKLPVLVYPTRFRGIVNRYFRFSPLSFLLGGAARFFYFLILGWKKGNRVEGVEIDEVLRLDEGFDRFWQRAQSLSQIIGVRDRNFLDWRYFQHPTRRYHLYRGMKHGEMHGYIVLTRMDLLKFNTAVIVDLLALDEETLVALVQKGIEFSRNQGTDLLGFMVPKPHPYCQSLKRMGFLPSLKAFLFMVYPHSTGETILDPEAWYVNWGDTDVI